MYQLNITWAQPKPSKNLYFGATHILLFTFSNGYLNPEKTLVTSIPHMSAVTLSVPRLVDCYSMILFLEMDMEPNTATITRILPAAQGRGYKKLCRSQSEFQMIIV